MTQLLYISSKGSRKLDYAAFQSWHLCEVGFAIHAEGNTSQPLRARQPLGIRPASALTLEFKPKHLRQLAPNLPFFFLGGGEGEV